MRVYDCVRVCQKAKKNTLPDLISQVSTFIELSTPLFTSFLPTNLVSTFHLAHLTNIKRFICQVAKAWSTLDDVSMCLKKFGN